ncbi:MAG: PKD domain-containing protein [Acidobacteria bacterium]|nr:PKD domain-containing protein [Acidobacteriota bacterium]
MIARSASQSAFESFWGTSLGSGTTFLDSGNSMPVINGDEVYALYDASGTLIDGTTIAIAAGQSVQRTDLCAAASSSSSWSIGSDSTATPGGGAVEGCGGGLRINEFSDASGTGNYIYEFVELHFDSTGSTGDVNEAPVASFTVSCSDLDCSFTDASSDPDGSVVGWDWSFGDGAGATNANPVHSYAAGGTYTVVLTVTDDQGATAQTSQELTVSAPSSGITLAASPYKVKGHHTVDLSWSGAISSQVDVMRDGSVIATTANDGAYTDSMQNKGGGSYTYRVCEAGTSTCSSSVSVTF